MQVFNTHTPIMYWFVPKWGIPVKWPFRRSNYNELWDLGVILFSYNLFLNFGSSVWVHKAVALDDLIIWARLLLWTAPWTLHHGGAPGRKSHRSFAHDLERCTRSTPFRSALGWLKLDSGWRPQFCGCSGNPMTFDRLGLRCGAACWMQKHMWLGAQTKQPGPRNAMCGISSK